MKGLWVSGLRLAESQELYWDREDRLCVDLSGRHPMLRIPADLEKGHKDRLLPVAPEFAELLLGTPEAKRRGPVFKLARLHGDGPPTEVWVGRVVCEIGKAAAVKVQTDAQTGRVKYASAHDLRRAFGARWAARIMPADLMVLMRHDNIETTMKYYVGRDAQTTASRVWDAYHKAGLGTISGTRGLSQRKTADDESAASSCQQMDF